NVSSIIWGKIIAVWLFGLALLSLTIIVYSLFNFNTLSGDVLGRVGLFYVSYALYYFIISGFTVVLATHWKNPTAVLTSMLGVWILWTIFLPNIILSSVEKWHPLPSRNTFQAEMKEDRSKGIDGHNPQDERGKELEEKILKEYSVDSISQLPINFDGIRMQADEEYGNKVWDKHFGQLRAVLKKQKKSYQLAGLLNPFIALQNLSMGFSGSDNLHHQEFLIQVESYRREFIKTLNDKHAFGGSRTGDWNWKASNDFYRSVKDYEYKPTSLNSIFHNYLLDLFILFGWSIFIVFFLFLGSQKLRII
ncbi:MAG: DUF3526 domain-containing protein, partial [Bacteroidota bacterium]